MLSDWGEIVKYFGCHIMGQLAELTAATTTSMFIAQIHGMQDKKLKPFRQRQGFELFIEAQICYQHHMVAQILIYHIKLFYCKTILCKDIINAQGWC